MDSRVENEYPISVSLGDEAYALFLQLRDSIAPSFEASSPASNVFDAALRILEIVAEAKQKGREVFLLRLESAPDRTRVHRLLGVDPFVLPAIALPAAPTAHVFDFWLPASHYHRCDAVREALRCVDLPRLLLVALYTLAMVARAVRNGQSFCTAVIVPPPDGQLITPLCLQDIELFEVSLRDVVFSPPTSLPPIEVVLPARTYVLLRELETHFEVVGASDTMTCVLLSVGDLVDVWKRDDVPELFSRMWFAGIDAREASMVDDNDGSRDDVATDVVVRLTLPPADRVTLALIASFFEMPQSDALFVRLISCAYYRMLQLTKKLSDGFPSAIP